MPTKVDFSTLNLQDALDLAILIEKESEERYLWFADIIGDNYPGDAASFFTMMARNEKIHGDDLRERRTALFSDAPSRLNANMIDDIEAPDLSKPRAQMSPGLAYDVAMESEIKAYNFFNEASIGIQDQSVRKLFEELRDEELGHQELLVEHKANHPELDEFDDEQQDIDTPSL